MKAMEGIKNLGAKGLFQLKKQSPTIFVGLGIAGLGVTAYLAYKAKPKVEEVVDDMEWGASVGQPMEKTDVIKGVATAVAPVVLTGVASVTCFVLAHEIQNRRIKALAGSLSTIAAERFLLKKKVVDKHGKDEAEVLFQPTQDELRTVTDKDGVESLESVPVQRPITTDLNGIWYADSSEYVEEAYAYNLQQSTSAIRELDLRLFSRGWILMNEVLDRLGLPRTKQGALLGWSTSNSPEFGVEHARRYNDETGVLETTNLFISWNPPTYIYDNIEFNTKF